MFQLLNISFTSYYEPYIEDINDIDRVEKEQGQVLMSINNQDLLTDLCQIRNEIITIYQKLYGINSISTNPVSINRLSSS